MISDVKLPFSREILEIAQDLQLAEIRSHSEIPGTLNRREVRCKRPGCVEVLIAISDPNVRPRQTPELTELRVVETREACDDLPRLTCYGHDSPAIRLTSPRV